MSRDRRASLLDAFRFAGRGVIEAARSQRSMRLHLVAAVLAATFGAAFPLGAAEQLALAAFIFLVPAAEAMNTALEAAVDLAADRPDERARLAKDAAAGAVLVLAAGAVAVFGLVVALDLELLRSGWREAGGALGAGAAVAALSAALAFPFRRPRVLDRLAAAAGAALLAVLALAARNPAFAAVAALAFAACAAAAFARRAGAAGEGAGPADRPAASGSPPDGP